MSRKLLCLMSLVLVLGMASTSLARLEGYWPLDGNTLDASGNGRDGTLVGDADWAADPYVEGAVGQAIFFDGMGYVNIDDYKGISSIDGVQQEFSISNWFRTTGDGEMVTWGTSAGRTRLTWRVNGGRLRTEHGAGNLRGNTYVDDGEWHHGALVVTEGANLRVPNTLLYLDGAPDSTFSGSDNPYELGEGADVSIGRRADNDSRYFPGSIDEVYIFSRTMSDEQVAGVMDGVIPVWPKADRPSPEDGAMLEENSVFLSWRPGTNAVSHNVYFGTTEDLGDDQLVSQQEASEYLATGIEPDNTYYWRVDEVAEDGTVTMGDVYSFWTPPRSAYDPSPANGNSVLGDSATLTWEAGWGPIMHQVYFGTDQEEVANAVGAPLVMDIGYDTGALEPDTTYYWRVDEFYGTDTVKGPVWSFSTVPVLPMADDPNLVVQYSFDQSSNNIVLDESGNANHGAMFDGAELITAGLVGDTALNLPGEDEYVAIDGLSYETTDAAEVSVSAWIRTDDGSNQIIASYDRNEYWRLEINGNGGGFGQVGWDVLTSEGQSDYGSERRVDDGIWHHVCGVYDNGLHVIYVDGVAEPSVTIGTTMGTGTVRYGYVGVGSESEEFDANKGPTDYFNGLIDDFRIYDRALSAEEIQELTRVNPGQAWNPTPLSGDSGDILALASLSWNPGDDAVEHDVYLGADSAAVEAADVNDTTGIYRGRLTEASYIADDLDFSTTYFWRVDEVAADGTVTPGLLWSFTTDGDLVIFEEETVIPYDNTVDPFITPADLDFDPALDLTDPIARMAVNYTGQAAPGSLTVGDVNTTVVGRGDDIWNDADQFQYAYTTLTGDGTMTVKVESLDYTNPWTKAGIMIRETLDAGSTFAAVYATGENGVRFQGRSMANQDAESDSSVATDEQKALTPPVWIRIERAFPMVNAYYSTDGVNFTPMAWNPQVIPMSPAPIFIGLAVTSHSGDDTYAEAVFSEITSEGGVAPGPLTSVEIGLESNSAEPMYLVLEDSSGASAAVMNPDPMAVQQASATDWIVELADFDIDLSAVAKATLVIGNLDAPAPGGTGTVTVNNVRFLPELLSISTLDSLEAEVDPDNPNQLTEILAINGINAANLIVGTTTTDFEKHAGREAVNADNLSLVEYASLDDSTFIQTMFDQPVNTIFIMERGANDSGFFQALDADGNPIGGAVAFTPDDFELPESGLKIVNQDAGGVAISASMPIDGLLILPPADELHTLDPASISAVAD